MKSFAYVIYVIMIYSVRRANCSPTFNETFFNGEGFTEDCQGKRLEFNERMRDVKCMPRRSLQRLDSEPAYFYLPNVVQVNKCDGFCVGYSSCKPLETTRKLILVKRSSKPMSNSMSCYRVYVEEHTRCKCGCKVTEKDCNLYQVYNTEQCGCTCTNFQEQKHCSYRTKMVWNPEKCKCTCAVPEQECTTGLEWIPSICRCGQLMPTTQS